MSKAQQPTVGEQTYVVNLPGVDADGAGDLDLGGVNGGGSGGATDVTSAGARLLVATAAAPAGREPMTPAELRIGPR